MLHQQFESQPLDKQCSEDLSEGNFVKYQLLEFKSRYSSKSHLRDIKGAEESSLLQSQDDNQGKKNSELTLPRACYLKNLFQIQFLPIA